jgi:hypothetical protein
MRLFAVGRDLILRDCVATLVNRDGHRQAPRRRPWIVLGLRHVHGPCGDQRIVRLGGQSQAGE